MTRQDETRRDNDRVFPIGLVDWERTNPPSPHLPPSSQQNHNTHTTHKKKERKKEEQPTTKNKRNGEKKKKKTTTTNCNDINAITRPGE